MASPTWSTWVWASSGSWWWTGRPGMLQFIGSQRVGHDWATEQQWQGTKIPHAMRCGQKVKWHRIRMTCHRIEYNEKPAMYGDIALYSPCRHRYRSNFTFIDSAISQKTWNAGQWVREMFVQLGFSSQRAYRLDRELGVFISYYMLIREGAWSHRAGQGDLAEVRDGWEAWELLRVALQRWWASLETQMVKESAYNARDPGSIPGSGRCLGEGSWHPFPASGSFLTSQLFASGGQSIGASASVFPMKIQGWFALGLTDLISLLSKGLSRVFSNTTVQKHQFFSSQPFYWSSSHICTWPLEKL